MGADKYKIPNSCNDISWNFIDCRTHFLSEKSFSKPLYYLIQIEIQREREREYKECEMFKNPSGMN